MAALGLLIAIWAFRSCGGGPLYSKQTYNIALNTNWAPIQLFGKEPNLAAFMTDLITDIVELENLNANLFTASTGNLFQALDDETYDAIIVTSIPNSYLEERYLFSKPFYLSGPVLVVSAKSNVHSLNELVGKPIGILKGSSLLFEVEKDRTSMLFISYDSISAALDDLIANVLNGVIIEMPLAYTYEQSFYSGKIKIATPPLTKMGIRLVTQRNRSGELLIDRMNKGLKKLQKNGEYSNLIKKWELPQPILE